MTTTVYIDSGSTTLGNVATFTRVVATESAPSTQSAVSLVKRVTADTTLDNDNGGPGILFSRGYGTTNANDTQFALIGARYKGLNDIHEIRFNTSVNDGSTYTNLMSLSTQNADFNMPVGMNAYANVTAINAIPNPVAGMVVYNTAGGTLYVYNGTQWNDVAATAASYTLPAASTSALGGVIIPVVGTSGITNSSGTIGLATASTTQLGAVKVDGSTVTINGGGVISANTSYTLPTATTSVLGGVKIDGTTITINGSGVISSTSAQTLNALTDVTLTSPSKNQFLVYDTGTSQWVNNAIISATGRPEVIFERQTTAAAGGATSLFGAVRVMRRITDATTGYDEGGAGIVFESVGTDNVIKGNALIGAYNNTGDVSDFAVITSNNGGSTYAQVLVSSQSRTNINDGLIFADKTNGFVGINDTTPSYALDVNGQVRATSGFIGNLTGNADTVTNGVVTTGSYSNPSWITSLAYSKLTGVPTAVTTLDSLTDVTISNAQKGKFLYYNGTAWVDSSAIEFNNVAYRPRFTNNTASGTVSINSAAEFLKNTADAPAQGDGTGVLFGTVQTDGTRRLLSRLVTEYRTNQSHKVSIQTSDDDFNASSFTVATFAGDGTTINSNVTISGSLSLTSTGPLTLTNKVEYTSGTETLTNSGIDISTGVQTTIFNMAFNSVHDLEPPTDTSKQMVKYLFNWTTSNYTRTITVNGAGWGSGLTRTLTLPRGSGVTLWWSGSIWAPVGSVTTITGNSPTFSS